MKIIQKAQLVPLILVLLLATALAVPTANLAVYAAQPTVDLGTASSFGVLAGSAITNTGPTSVSGTAGGDIGLHPGTSFTGAESVTVSGHVYLGDAVAEQAKFDLLAAYNDAAGRTTDKTIDADLGGRTLTPGVYTSASSIGITGTLILDAEGDPNAVFIFQAGSELTTATDSRIVLINGAGPCRIFWQVGSSATLGTDSYFVGHILAMESITATTDAEVQGQLLARNGAVTLDTNTITNDVCLSSSSSFGSLTVTKEVYGSVHDIILPDFEITVTWPHNFSVTQTIEAGNSITWEGMAPGTYTVSEGELSEEWNVSGIGEYNVQLGEETKVTITNSWLETENGDDVDENGTRTRRTGNGLPAVTTETSDEVEPIEEPEVEPIQEPDVESIEEPEIEPTEEPELEIDLDEEVALAGLELPQTGDGNPIGFYLTGLFLILGGILLRKRSFVKSESLSRHL